MSIIVVYPGQGVMGGMLSVVNDFDECFETESVKVSYIQTHGTNPKWSIYCLIIALFKFIKLILTNKIDAIYIHTASKGSFYRKSIFCILGFMLRKKVILHMHGGGFKEFFYSSSPLLKRYIAFVLVNFTDRLIVLTDGWNNWFTSNFNFVQKPITVKNSVKKIEENKNDGIEEIIFVGRLSEEKGVSDLLKALKSLNISRCFQLNVVGSGDIDFEAVVYELGICEKVNFFGQLARKEAQKLIGSADILVLPSYKEGLPIVILEAMSAHTTVIASNVGGIPEIIDDGYNGLLVEAGNISSLTKALTFLINNPMERKNMADKAFQEWVCNYTFESNFKIILKLVRGEI